MCSISTVTTSHVSANAFTAALSLKLPTTCVAAIDAGARSVGSSAFNRTPIGAPAIASMRPSCPPPNIPTRQSRPYPSNPGSSLSRPRAFALSSVHRSIARVVPRSRIHSFIHSLTHSPGSNRRTSLETWPPRSRARASGAFARARSPARIVASRAARSRRSSRAPRRPSSPSSSSM